MKGRPTERPYTTALYLLRCIQIGLSMSDLDFLDYGTVIDMMTEAQNDNYQYKELATQADFDRF